MAFKLTKRNWAVVQIGYTGDGARYGVRCIVGRPVFNNVGTVIAVGDQTYLPMRSVSYFETEAAARQYAAETAY